MNLKGTDAKDLGSLWVTLAIVCGAVLITDIILLVRWLIYQVQVGNTVVAGPVLPITPPIAPSRVSPDETGQFDLGPTVSTYETLEAEAPTASAAFDGIDPALVDAGFETPGDPADGPAVKPEIATSPTSPTLRPPFAPTWSVTHPFLGIQAVVFLANFLGIVLAIFLFMFGSILHRPMAEMQQTTILIVVIFTLIAQNVLFVGVVAFFLNRYGLRLVDIGLGRPTLRLVGLGLGLGFVALGLSFVIEQGVGHLINPSTLKHLTKLSEAADAGTLFKQISSPWVKLVFAVCGFVLAPIGEEVFFRGLLYNALKRRWNIPVAIMVSALAFAAIHFNPLGLLPIFVMGMLLAYVYERTGSLWTTILIHATNNGFAFLMLWLFPKLGS